MTLAVMNDNEYGRMFEVEDSHWWYVTLHRLILKYVAREHNRKGPLDILDAGCGTGRLCQLMSGFGNVQGVDMSGTAVKLCRKRALNAVYQADLNSMDLGKDRFDVIT